MLWSLPKAAPALLRHLAAYVDLASLDLERSRREIAAEFLASAIVALCALFVVFMACLAVVAYTWDTPHRVSAIIWMGAGFLAAALLALAYRSNAVRAKSEFLASVRQAWREDQVLLERILSSDED
ncbi:MAG TPA: phage holin family protein [Steroidobacteraceae bacterium]|jgi:uncharacterized membrane protein YqjE